MAHVTHTLGFPRIGVKRELKHALERYWAGKCSRQELLESGRALRERHWQWQQEAGLDLLPVGDFAWYDQVLGTSLLLGNVPPRHRNQDGTVDLDTLFRIAPRLLFLVILISSDFVDERNNPRGTTMVHPLPRPSPGLRDRLR